MERTDHAAAVSAGRHQFLPGEDFEHETVGSRRLLWCLSGSGAIVSGGREIPLRPGTLVLLPWRHDLRTRPDPVDPFLTGAVHVVPWHSRDVSVEHGAGHGARDPLNRTDARRDVDWPGYRRVAVLTGPGAERLIRLGESVVDHFRDDLVDETSMRAYGVALARAVLGLRADPSTEDIPSGLARMTEYVRSHYWLPISAEELARAGRCSTSTVERLFRRHTGQRPQQWIRNVRLEQAARLLRTSNLSVSEIARRCGFDDPFYFSRQFRARYGMPPSGFSRRSSPWSTS